MGKMQKSKETKQDVILLNNLFNGEYISENIGGEIINVYQSDNGKYYVYVNPYGNIDKKWDNRVKYVLFIRSVGNRIVKVIGKAIINEQICLNAVRKLGEGIDVNQKKYIDDNNITYGNVKIDELGSWSNFFVTFEAAGIYKAKRDIYLAPSKNQINLSASTFILEDIEAINNQSQKLYIETNSINYEKLENIIKNADLWKKNAVGKVNLGEENKDKKSFLSIIKKENDELVNSNLLAYFFEKDKTFWTDFVENVLKITDKDIINGTPKITRELIGNIDIFIEVGGGLIIIENKIKSGITGQKDNGYSQLEKYIEVVEAFQNEIVSTSKKQPRFYLLRPNYNNEDYSIFNKGNQYQEIKYSDIYEIIKNRECDFYFNELKKVVKKHSAEYDNELFEIMNERFIEQIKKQT